MKRFPILILVSLLLTTTISYLSIPTACAFTITATLTGDPRLQNPDDLKIGVVIDVTGNLASWTVDLDMAGAHADVKLDEFHFNMAGAANDYSFSSFVPAGWNVQSPGTLQGGGGGSSTFLFESERLIMARATSRMINL